MRKFLALLILASSAFMFAGCNKKTTEEKATDAVESAQKDAGKIAKDAQKDADKAAEDGKKKLDGLMK